MLLTESELNDLIDKRVAAKLAERQRPRVCPGWLDLRDEISDYCHSVQDSFRGPVFSKSQNAIYAPIKYALHLKRIDDISENQVDEARRLFNVIKYMYQHG